MEQHKNVTTIQKTKQRIYSTANTDTHKDCNKKQIKINLKKKLLMSKYLPHK